MRPAVALAGLVATLATPGAGAARADVGAEVERARAAGLWVEVAPDRASYRIRDVAGEGAPLVGRVERRAGALYLVADGGAGPARRMTGPLAVPRIAGPGYTVWVLGVADGAALRVRRIGVLARPDAR
jgi:hypothetical protein